MYQLEDKLKQIYNFFESKDRDSQIFKLIEENQETCLALNKYLMYPTDANFRSLLEEIIDIGIIALQIGLCKHKLNLSVIKDVANDKIDRTISIMNIMNLTGDSYEKIRKDF